MTCASKSDSGDGVLSGEGLDLLAHFLNFFVLVHRVAEVYKLLTGRLLESNANLDCLVAPLGNLVHLCLVEASSRKSTSAQSDATGVNRGFVTDQRVLVHGHIDGFEHLLNLGTGKVVGPHIPHHHVGVSTTGKHDFASLDKASGESASILNNLLAVNLELRSSDLFQLGGESRNLVVVRAAL